MEVCPRLDDGHVARHGDEGDTPHGRGVVNVHGLILKLVDIRVKRLIVAI